MPSPGRTTILPSRCWPRSYRFGEFAANLGPPHWQIAWHEWRDGFHFALQTASQSAFGSTDKPVVAALSDLSVAGVYAAASRIVAAAGIPVSALLYSAYVRFFQVGVAGPRASARLAVRLLPVGVGLGALGTVAILVLAPLAPRVLGHSYIGTDAALLLLAPLPVSSRRLLPWAWTYSSAPGIQACARSRRSRCPRSIFCFAVYWYRPMV